MSPSEDAGGMVYIGYISMVLTSHQLHSTEYIVHTEYRRVTKVVADHGFEFSG